ncbi:MAG: DUF2384 domain-containing protein [Cyclobacteriaceae bacterium]
MKYIVKDSPPSIVKEAAVTYGFSNSQMAELLGVSDKTYYNMMKSKTLDTNQGDRFNFINDILNEGEEAFGSRENFKDWLHSTQPTLNGHTPIKMMATLTGAQEVLATLTRIKYGIFV